mgnify:CR=1 FL=1
MAVLAYGGYYSYFSYWDPTYFLVLIGVVISLIASAKVHSTFSRFSKVRNRSGYTGAQTAERMLIQAGITEVQIRHVAGNLTDHYNPKTKELCLSDSVYDKATVAAVSVAAHECGHAIQHSVAYTPLTLRSALVPIAKFGSSISWLLIIVGILLSMPKLIPIGIILFSAAVLFQIVTLPVEFNASRRAIEVLPTIGVLSEEEVPGAKKVLNAAALTYVAAAAASILQLLRLVLLFGGRNRD